MATGIPYAFGDDMRFALAAIVGVHGVAHLVGFVSSWRLATLPELPYKTTTFAGRFEVGDAGICVVIPHPNGSLTHAITIRRQRHATRHDDQPTEAV
jgi:hypothetical protein